MGFLIEYQGIKGLYLVRSRDQGKFLAIKTLDPGRKWFYRAYERDYPLYISNAHQFLKWGIH